MIKVNKKIIIVILIFSLFIMSSNKLYAKNEIDEKGREYITDLNHINITNDLTKDFKLLENSIETKRPKAIYIEQWIIVEPHNKKLLKKLSKITKEYEAKLYIVIGKNTWFGKRGFENTSEAYKLYGKYIDGVVLRVEPNKTNVWKDDLSIKAQVLNHMLDAYSAIHQYAKKLDKQFIAEFPFWLNDFKGPNGSFSEDACKYTDKIIFLIDDLEKMDELDELDINWNDISCRYNINLTKRALDKTEESIIEIYKKLKVKLPLYSNFNGFIIDSDSQLLDNTEDNTGLTDKS